MLAFCPLASIAFATPLDVPAAVLEPRFSGFSTLFAGDGSPRVLAESQDDMFHEAGVWFPSQKAWLVTSNRFNASCNCDAQHILISLVNEIGGWKVLPQLSEQIVMANGGTTDGAGGAFLVSQGIRSTNGAVYHVSADLSTTRLPGPKAESGEEIVLNSPGDIVLHPPTGTLVVTDPSYGVEVQFFRDTYTDWPKGNVIWTTNTQGSAWAAFDAHVPQPNGVVFSPDLSKLYLSSVWDPSWHSAEPGHSLFDPHVHLASGSHPHSDDETARIPTCEILVADVRPSEGVLAISKPRHLFDLICSASRVLAGRTSVFSDGLKVDERGNIYTGGAEGVYVHSPLGVLLGIVKIEGGVANLVFGGVDGRTLLALNEKRAIAISMSVAGVLGPYA